MLGFIIALHLLTMTQTPAPVVPDAMQNMVATLDGIWTIESFERQGSPNVQSVGRKVSIISNVITPMDVKTSFMTLRIKFGADQTVEIWELPDASKSDVKDAKFDEHSKRGSYVATKDFLAISIIPARPKETGKSEDSKPSIPDRPVLKTDYAFVLKRVPAKQ
ncbi:hypothetical protein KIH39_06315 [Telmatocola sphagniphila]|uniref:TIGR03067 domain-containing protein n=1 Tax=Telmatocola sphagniphila TaxID=1123043 RepID=A0A8E6EW21_9BACT|nr:hypothetical protein [Telmatocola sphagniphila]QVL33520.1 hypothetical protein KIH39_06315 [Telmatocola sphagniphila]